jgi:hypothetical protein
VRGARASRGTLVLDSAEDGMTDQHTEHRTEPVQGDVIDGGVVRAYTWEWSDIGGPRGRSRLPWFGIFLVVFGGLMLLQLVFPALAGIGSVLFLAVGLAFLVSWLINRGVGSLYLGSIIAALAAPELLASAGIVKGPGVGMFCLGLAFLFIAAVRASSHGGWGWQAGLAVLPLAIGASSMAIPGFNELFWPIVLVVIGGFVLIRASTARR